MRTLAMLMFDGSIFDKSSVWRRPYPDKYHIYGGLSVPSLVLQGDHDKKLAAMIRHLTLSRFIQVEHPIFLNSLLHPIHLLRAL